MNELSFLHISDMHLTGSDGKHSCRAERLSYDIKIELLKSLAKIIRREGVKVVLISGDIETEKPDELSSIFGLWHEEGAKTYVVFGCPGPHDTAVKRKMLLETVNSCHYVEIFHKTGFVNDDELGFSVWGVDSDWNDERFMKNFIRLKKPLLKYPSIFLTHRPVIEERIDLMHSFGCNYYACGHHHHARIREISGTQVMGLPGHLFSTWDGSGKAWPTGYIQGKLSHNKPEIGWCMFPGPQTRRIWINRFRRCGNLLEFGIDNAPESRTRNILQYCQGNWFSVDGYEEKFQGFINPNFF
ncbi:MAG: metallophosphoesterase [Victivallaceae bacterium]